MAPNENLEFHCPRCRSGINVPAAQAGDTIDCPACQQPLVVPGLKMASSGAFDDLFEVEDSEAKSKPTISQEGSASESRPVEDPSQDEPAVEKRAELAVDDGLELVADDDVSGGGDDDTPSAPSDLLGGEFRNLRNNQPLSVDEAKQDPFAVQENAPLRIDGIGDGHKDPTKVSCHCQVCGSVTFVPGSLAGTKIKCTDCHSLLLVELPKAEPVKDETKPSDPQTKARTTPDRMDSLPDFGVSSGGEASDEYGLAPIDEDLLAPRVESNVTGGFGQFQDGSSDATTSDQPDVVYDELEVVNPSAAPVPAVPVRTDPVPSPTPRSDEGQTRQATPVRPTPQSPSGENDSGDADPDSTGNPTASNANGAESIDSLPIAEQLYAWGSELFRMVVDPSVVSRGFIVFLFLIPAYILFDIGSGMLAGADPDVPAPVSIFPFGGGGFFYMLAFITGGILISQIIIATSHGMDRDIEWPDFDPTEMFSSFLTSGFSLWISTFPGVMVGYVIWALSNQFFLFIASIIFSTMFLGPIFILSALVNGSPFMIVSKDVFVTLSTHPHPWLRFYALIAVLFFGTLISFAMLYIPTLIGSILAAVAQTALIIMFGRLVGMHARGYLKDWGEPEPNAG